MLTYIKTSNLFLLRDPNPPKEEPNDLPSNKCSDYSPNSICKTPNNLMTKLMKRGPLAYECQLGGLWPPGLLERAFDPEFRTPDGCDPDAITRLFEHAPGRCLHGDVPAAAAVDVGKLVTVATASGTVTWDEAPARKWQLLVALRSIHRPPPP